MGGARRKHAGHAIDQTSKRFDDGYKEISKGSGVRFVDETNGVFGIGAGLVAREFCRTWTKDNPYYTFKNLQRSGGLLRGNPDSVLSKTYDLNIAPNMGHNVDANGVKKYMFSFVNFPPNSQKLRSCFVNFPLNRWKLMCFFCEFPPK